MPTVIQLRQRAEDLQERAEALADVAEDEDRELTESERASKDEWLAEANGYLKRAEEREENQKRAEARRASAGRVSTPIAGRIEAGEQEADRRSGISDFVRNVAIACEPDFSHREKEAAGEFLTNQYRSKYRSWKDDTRSPETRTMSSTSGALGGWTMPTQFYKEIMALAAPMSIVRQRAKVIPMSTLEIEIPLLDVTTAQSAGVPPYFGGLTAAWTGDGASIASTEPKFRIGKLTRHELTGYTEIPRGLLATSVISLEALVYEMYGGAVAWYEDYAFLRGSGIGKPLGVLVAACRVSTAARGSASAITFANARSVWVKVLAESRKNGVWLGSQLAESAILDMAGTANSVMVPSGYTVLNGNAAAQEITYGILGRPLVISAKLPNLNVDGDFGFFDFSQYLIGDGGSMEVAASEHFKFQNNMMAYRFVHSVGGMPWLNSYVTLEDGSTTVSPFVSLAVQ